MQKWAQSLETGVFGIADHEYQVRFTFVVLTSCLKPAIPLITSLPRISCLSVILVRHIESAILSFVILTPHIRGHRLGKPQHPISHANICNRSREIFLLKEKRTICHVLFIAFLHNEQNVTNFIFLKIILIYIFSAISVCSSHEK